MNADEKRDLPNLQWFPGHMKKARETIRENLKLVDVAVELLDARIPLSSANPMLEEILEGKPRMAVLNKSDLADAAMTRRWVEFFRSRGLEAVAVDSVKGAGLKQMAKLAEELARPGSEKLVSKGARRRAARCMILGIPNVGKSSLINRLAGSAKTKTADKPGVTRAKQWIRIGANLELLDTPGVLWPKFEDMSVGLKLAFTGAINDEVCDLEQVAALLMETLQRRYPERLAERFRLERPLPEDGQELLEAVGRKRGCLMKGGRIDMLKAQRIVMTEFRGGKLGCITLDELPE